MPLPTKFLPAEVAPEGTVRRQNEAIAALPLVTGMLDAMPNMVLMLNDQRQIIYANKLALETLGVSLGELLGKRLGEAVNCVHAHDETGGCGTSLHCTACGAANAIACALRRKPDQRDCRIQVRQPGNDLDLKVWATPFRHQGLSFTIFAVADVSHENRRRVLESLFFHDVLNTAGGVRGLAELLMDSSPAEVPALAKLLNLSSEILVDEILAQRDLAAVEIGEYKMTPSSCPLPTFLDTVAKLCGAHTAADGRRILVDKNVPDESIVTDRALLARVMGNMIKNGLEAESPGAVITAGCEKVSGGRYALWVRNAAVIPRAVQLRIFQRSFSTKGAGRGLGTYSIKLLTERYLKGTASFSSVEGRGTEFRVTLPASLS
ncbi:MAG: ATP-binding protein [Elusimicrobiota bacterium]